MGDAKDMLYRVYGQIKAADEAVSMPGWLFHKLTDPFDQHAWVSDDSRHGVSDDCQEQLRIMRRGIESKFDHAVIDAWTAYHSCPDED